MKSIDYLPNPPWEEHEWAIYNDYREQLWRQFEILNTVHPSKKNERAEAEMRWAQNVAAIRQGHPRIRLRGTVTLSISRHEWVRGTEILSFADER